ncbi:MAG: hypothetical protein HY744_21825 [Deltaproteobacteria bacterium]|nr:hypothetical protein [Deltaproteobacteria bacterium]
MSSLDVFGWVGHDLGGAAIKAAVARGGFAVVYRARHRVFGADVALKCLELKPDLDKGERRRFLRLFLGEARAMYRLARLTASVVQPLNFGAERAPKGQWAPWLMLEWLDGCALADELTRRAEEGLGGMPLGDAMALLSPIAEALALAHAEGIAHRDVTPGQVHLIWF